MKIVLFIILSESVVSSENFEYQLKELPFMSPEHLEKLQQRISDSPGLLPKNMMGALFAMTLANQQNSAERFREFEEQLNETKDDLKDIKGDVSHIVKIGFKNLEANTKKILKDIQNEIKEIRQNPGVDHIPTEQNNHKLEETLRQIQEENRKLKQIHVHELQELREMLEKKVDKPKQEFDRLDEIPLVDSIPLKPSDLKKANYNTKEIDDKFAEVYEFVNKEINQKNETQEQLRREAIHHLEEENTQINNKLESLSVSLENIKKSIETLDHKSKGDVESIEQKVSGLQAQIQLCQDQIDSLKVQPPADNTDLIDYVNQTVQEVRRNIEKRIDAKQAENLASFVSQLEELKENTTQKIQDISGRVEAGIAHIENALQAAEDELKIKLETINLTLTELMNSHLQNKDNAQTKLNATLSKKIAILERRFIPSQADLQAFKHIKPVFSTEIEDISIHFEPGQKTVYTDPFFNPVDKCFYSQEHLPDTGKYSFSFRYEGGEFEDGSLCFGVFPYENRGNPQLSKYKYLIEVINDEAYLEDNKFSFEPVELSFGGLINVYVDADRRSITFAIENQVILNYPLSNWFNGKMYCGFFVKNNKNIRMTFI